MYNRVVGKGNKNIWIPVSMQAWERLNGAEEFKTSKSSLSDWSLTWKLKVFKMVESLAIGLLFLDNQVTGYHMEEIMSQDSYVSMNMEGSSGIYKWL